MKLKEIQSKIYDDVCLYKENKQNQGCCNYKDLWRGKSQDIPQGFLDYTVRIIGAKRKGILDIEIRETEE